MPEGAVVMTTERQKKRKHPANTVGRSRTEITNLNRNNSDQPVRRGGNRSYQQEPE